MAVGVGERWLPTLMAWRLRTSGGATSRTRPSTDGQRVFHGGDTMFHGCWWLIARRFSPFDAVFLPANGAVVDAPHLQPPSPPTGRGRSGALPVQGRAFKRRGR